MGGGVRGEVCRGGRAARAGQVGGDQRVGPLQQPPVAGSGVPVGEGAAEAAVPDDRPGRRGGEFTVHGRVRGRELCQCGGQRRPPGGVGVPVAVEDGQGERPGRPSGAERQQVGQRPAAGRPAERDGVAQVADRRGPQGLVRPEHLGGAQPVAGLPAVRGPGDPQLTGGRRVDGREALDGRGERAPAVGRPDGALALAGLPPEPDHEVRAEAAALRQLGGLRGAPVPHQQGDGLVRGAPQVGEDECGLVDPSRALQVLGGPLVERGEVLVHRAAGQRGGGAGSAGPGRGAQGALVAAGQPEGQPGLLLGRPVAREPDRVAQRVLPAALLEGPGQLAQVAGVPALDQRAGRTHRQAGQEGVEQRAAGAAARTALLRFRSGGAGPGAGTFRARCAAAVALAVAGGGRA
ncbi:hypothetical protein ACFV0A_03365, partial [Streptomyces sp. NPDC059552]